MARNISYYVGNAYGVRISVDFVIYHTDDTEIQTMLRIMSSIADSKFDDFINNECLLALENNSTDESIDDYCDGLVDGMQMVFSYVSENNIHCLENIETLLIGTNKNNLLEIISKIHHKK